MEICLAPGYQQCLADLKRLLAEDGLDHVSASHIGRDRVGLPTACCLATRCKACCGCPATADIVNAATGCSPSCGIPINPELSPSDRQSWSGAGDAAVPAIVDAVAAAHCTGQ
jgi:hypothetical protein